jgi:hypothetical protein
MCVLILLYMCPRTAIYVSSYYYICVPILVYMGRHTTFMCVLMLLYMCPHTLLYIGIGTTQPSRQAGGAEVQAEDSMKYVFAYYYIGTYICVLVLYYIGATQPSRQAGGAEVEAEDYICVLISHTTV